MKNLSETALAVQCFATESPKELSLVQMPK